MKTKHKNLWMWGGVAAAIVGVTYLATRKSPAGGTAAAAPGLGLVNDKTVKGLNQRFHTPTGSYLVVANGPDGRIVARNMANGAVETIDPGNTAITFDN